MTVVSGTRRVATYERVSSEDQRERETIRTQTDELGRRLEREAGIHLVDRYVDDGVSGTIPLGERPAGHRLLRDAAAGRLDELWVYKVDRLGRDAVDLLVVRRRLDALGVKLISVVEGEPDLLGYDVQAVVADHYRREFMRRSADGINRAAREGRYCGGIVPLGFRVEGRASEARLVPDETTMWADLSAADLVRWIYRLIGIDGRSCRSVAADFTNLGVPTHYARDGRGVRGSRTQALWRAGHVRNMVVNPVYRGELRYGRRSDKRDREVIAAPIEGLVSPALWHAAQDTLTRNRVCAKNGRHTYLLRGVVRCGICGLTYCGSQGRAGIGWYRCNGQLADRGPLPGRCWGRSIRTDAIEPVVWHDIERFLRDPGDVLADLDAKSDAGAQAAIVAAESVTLTRRLDTLEAERQRAIGFAVRGVLTEESLTPELGRIAAERVEIERRLEALVSSPLHVPPKETLDLLAEVRNRLDEGLSVEQRQEIVRLLASIVVQTETGADGKRTVRLLVEYRFPGVVETGTGRRSSPPRAGSEPGRSSPGRLGRSPPGPLRAAAGVPNVVATSPRTNCERRLALTAVVTPTDNALSGPHGDPDLPCADSLSGAGWFRPGEVNAEPSRDVRMERPAIASVDGTPETTSTADGKDPSGSSHPRSGTCRMRSSASPWSTSAWPDAAGSGRGSGAVPRLDMHPQACSGHGRGV